MKHKIILLLFLSYFIFAQSSYHLFEVKRISKKNAQMSLTGGITDGFYIVSMGLGTPPQTVHLALDTGSSNLALVSQGCKYNGQPCLANNTYMTDKSSTINKDTCQNLTKCGSCKNSTQLQCTLSLTYADNTHVEGVVMSDYINFSNFSSQIYFGAITNDFNGNFASNKTDGVLGLAYGSIDENNLPSFLCQITQNLKLRDMFSICMGYRGGSFLLGGVDPDYHVGDIMYTPIIKPGYYTVQMNMIQIANYEDSLIINTNKYDTYIDSGTSQIIVPKIIYNQIVTKFRNLCKDNVLKPFLCDEGNIFDISPDKCTHFDRNVFAKLPDLKFQFKGISDGSVFEVSINPRNFFIYVNSPGSGFDFCGQFGIAAVDGIDQIILGDTFMRSFYLVFDRENKIIGISYSKNCGGNIPSTASNPLTYLGIGLSLGVVILGASSMFLIIYVKTKRERYQQLQLQNINL